MSGPKHEVIAFPAEEEGAVWLDIRIGGMPFEKFAEVTGFTTVEPSDLLDGPFLRVKINDRLLPEQDRAHLSHARSQQNVLFVEAPWTDGAIVDLGEAGTAISKIVFEKDNTATLLLGWRAADDRPYRVVMGHPVRVGPPDIAETKDGVHTVRTWGLRRLGPGVWSLSPSVRDPAHGWVVITDVPQTTEDLLFAMKKEG